MFHVYTKTSGITSAEGLWPILMAIFTMAAVHFVLPSNLRAGPAWLQMSVQIALVMLLVIARKQRNHKLMHWFGGATLSVSTLTLVYSLSSMFILLAEKKIEAPVLLRSGALLWINTVLLFAAWYWRLDGGGAHQRFQHVTHRQGAFLFPQMTLDTETLQRLGIKSWHPIFIDYLFIAFTNSTAFSPTDVLPHSRWAKVLMMIQSLISLIIVAVLAARAINIL